MGNNDKGVCPVCRKEGDTSCNVIEQGTGRTEGQKKGYRNTLGNWNIKSGF
jgi:hypothetical protein